MISQYDDNPAEILVPPPDSIEFSDIVFAPEPVDIFEIVT